MSTTRDWPTYADGKPWPADRFTVTEDHVKLLARANVRFQDEMEWGAPEIDPKRPYGNSDLFGDMREILGRPSVGEDEPDRDELMKLHRETATALQILLRTHRLEPGEYKSPKYYRDWRAA